MRAALFGLVVRNKETEERDIDLLVEFEEGRSVLDLGGLRADLEELLNMRVDVVTYNTLHPLLKESIPILSPIWLYADDHIPVSLV